MAYCRASRCSVMARSSRLPVRPDTPYARITSAPTTLSDTPLSMAAARSRTRPYAPSSRCWQARITSTAGTNEAMTTSVNGELYAAMTAVVTRVWPTQMSSTTPFHCRNPLIWSTSPVTRETRAPRRSVCWCSIDRLWTCRNTRVRTAASAVSLTRNSRYIMRYPAPTATSRTAAVNATTSATMPRSGPPDARSPRSMPCWIATGTATRPAVMTTASRNVPASPRYSSGESASPRRSVRQVDSVMRRRPRPAGSEGAQRPSRAVGHRAAGKAHDPRERSERQQARSCAAARGRPGASRDVQGHGQPAAGCLGRRDRAAHGLGEPARDREPETEPHGVGAVVQALKRGEDALPVAGRYAGAVVDDVQPYVVAVGVAVQPDPALGWARGAGVGDEVGHDAFEQSGVRVGEGQVVGDVHVDRAALGRGVQQGLGDDRVERHRLPVHAEDARLQPAHRQQVLS